MKNNKEFKNLEEQIEIFKSKGLIVNNIDYAKEVLLRENYFFLRVKKPLRGFSLTSRSAGRSHGVPLAFFAVLVKK